MKVDLVGQRFGKLVVVSRYGTDKHRKAQWLCQCDCGNTTVTITGSLHNGCAKSCGCNREQARQKAVAMNTIHGAYSGRGGKAERLHVVWTDMRVRCEKENSVSYRYYGARGIRVCDEWRDSYKAFRGWAVANGYNESAPRGECTLDRIDVNGNYEPSNCRWVDMKTQARNRRPRIRG